MLFIEDRESAGLPFIEDRGLSNLQVPFEKLKAAAKPRPDLGVPATFTFAGRAVAPGETKEEALARLPLGELEAGSLAATGQLDLAAGVALGGLIRQSPSAIIGGAKKLLGALPAQYEAIVDKVGQAILSRTPKVFRAGRGAPLEFRESRAQMEADIANGIEKGLELGTPLQRELTTGERLRADQILRGSIATAKTPEKAVAFTSPVRVELDRLQDELLKLGKLSPETIARFENNFGPYFARLYASKELVEKTAVLPWSPPIRAGTPRLKMRGERIEVELPSLEKEMKDVAKLVGPEVEFKRTFREAARGLAKRKETITQETVTEKVLGEQRTAKLETSVEGGPGEFTEVPLSGVMAKLEKVVTDALQTRGMTLGEASAAVGRVKAGAVKAASEKGIEAKITAGGTTKETVTETIKQTVEKSRETIKTIIENLGINKAQQAALHAYYDAITRAGMKTKRITVGGETYKIKAVMDADSAIERVEALDDFLTKGFRVEAREGSKVTLFRDIPETVRKEMGELRDQPGFVAAKSVAQLNREVAVNKFFNTIARNSEWTSEAAKSGFTQMGDSKKALGELAEKWVRSDIASELNEITRIKADWEKITGRLTQMWKVGKVTNPATISRNTMSSAMMADWGGLSPFRPSGIRSYAKTAEGFLGKDAGAQTLLQEAKIGGLFRATFNQQEINNLAEGFVKSPEQNGMLRILDGMSQAFSKVGEKVGHPTRLYGAVDHFFKGALYVHGRTELGMSPKVALRYSKKYGIDYQDISPAVRLLREFPFGAPFATFASKAIPLSIETAIKHPVRFWKWPVGLLGIDELASQSFQSERDQIAGIQDLGELKSPRFITLPIKDKDGRFQFLDLGYILSFGDILESIDRLRGGTGTNIAFEVPGGPGKALLEVALNKSDFTGKPIYGDTDTLKEASAKIIDFLLKAWLPAFTPPIPYTGFRGGHSVEAFRKAIAPQIQLPGEAPISPTDFFGRQQTLGTTVASKLFGLNIKSAALQEIQRVKINQLQNQIGELSAQLVRAQRSGITDEQKELAASRVTDKIRKLLEEAREKLSAHTSAGARETGKFIEDRK